MNPTAPDPGAATAREPAPSEPAHGQSQGDGRLWPGGRYVPEPVKTPGHEVLEQLARFRYFVALEDLQPVDAAALMALPERHVGALQRMIDRGIAPLCLCSVHWPALAISLDECGMPRVHLPLDAPPAPENEAPGAGVHARGCLFRLLQLGAPARREDGQSSGGAGDGGGDGGSDGGVESGAAEGSDEDGDMDAGVDGAGGDGADADDGGAGAAQPVVPRLDASPAMLARRAQITAFLALRSNRLSFTPQRTFALAPPDAALVKAWDVKSDFSIDSLLHWIWSNAGANTWKRQWRRPNRPLEDRTYNDVENALRTAGARARDPFGAIQPRLFVPTMRLSRYRRRLDPEGEFTPAEIARLESRALAFEKSVYEVCSHHRLKGPFHYVLGLVNTISPARSGADWFLHMQGLNGRSYVLRWANIADRLRERYPEAWALCASERMQAPRGTRQWGLATAERNREAARRRMEGRFQVAALLQVAYPKRNSPLAVIDGALMITSLELLPAATREDAQRLHVLTRRRYDVSIPMSHETRLHDLEHAFVRRTGRAFRRFDPGVDLVDWRSDYQDRRGEDLGGDPGFDGDGDDDDGTSPLLA